MKSGYTPWTAYTRNSYENRDYIGPFSGGEETVDLANGLYAYYLLGEGSGTRVDSVGARNLTETGTVNSGTGIHGNASQWPAGSNYLESAATFDLGQTNSGVTVALWIKRSAIASVIIADFWDLSEDWTVSINGSGQLSCFARNSLNTFLSATSVASVCDDAWHLIITEWNENHDKRIHLYIPSLGESRVSAAGGSEFLLADAASMKLTLGARASNHSGTYGAAYNPLIDEVGVWSRALNSRERAALYNAGAGTFYPF